MFERFTDDAREIVVDSQTGALAMGHRKVGTEHLLLALAKARSGCSRQVLGDVGISAEQIRAQVTSCLGVGEPIPTGSPVPWTQPAKKLLELSLRQMLERNDPDIGPEHMFLASALVADGGSRAILVELGTDFDQLKTQVDKQRSH